MSGIGVIIKSSQLNLEGSLDHPEGTGRIPGVVLCHPHPLYGGEMNNSVIRALSRSLNAKGIAVLRFNFRGVGRSEGVYANGEGETEDALAALSFLSCREEVDPALMAIAGYSFGGMVAFSAGRRSNLAQAIAGVSPVLQEGTIRECSKPMLIVSGSCDQIIPSQSILKTAEGMVGPKTIEIIEGADHFWQGYTDFIADLVADFFIKAFENITY